MISDARAVRCYITARRRLSLTAAQHDAFGQPAGGGWPTIERKGWGWSHGIKPSRSHHPLATARRQIGEVRAAAYAAAPRPEPLLQRSGLVTSKLIAQARHNGV